MTNNCTYIFNNKQYSKQGLLRALDNSRDIIPLISDNALNFLKRNLNMSEDEIVFVAGLIDGKSLGRFKEDGKILLSSLADDSVAYHEAFHRVYRGYLSDRERNDVIKEFKKRKNWKSLIEGYKVDYPQNTDNENIEEFLADEFADYIVNDGKINIEQPIRSVFQRIINFIRKVLGMKATQIKQVYDKIKDGGFSNYTLNKNEYKPADKVIINGNQYSSDIKNDFVQSVARVVIERLLNEQSIYDFIKYGSKADITNIYRDSFNLINEILFQTNPELADDLMNDAFYVTLDNKLEVVPNSYINNQFSQYIETLIGKFEFTMVEEGEMLDEEETGETNKEGGRQQDDNVWKASFEIDPKTNMSKAIKMLLASFEDMNKPNSLGFATQVRWSQAFNKIARHLAGVPSVDVISHLAKLNESWVNDLIDRLGGVTADGKTISPDMLRLRNDFIKTFSKTEHTYSIAKITDKTIGWFDANQDTAQKKVTKTWKNNLVVAIKNSGSFDNWVNNLKETLDNKYATDEDFENILGIKVDDELKNQILYTINNENYYYMTAMYSIGKYILKAVDKNKFSDAALPDYNKIFDKNNFDVEGLIEHIAKAQLEYEDAVDLMLFSRDKKLYGISLNTHTTTTVNTLNYISSIIDPNDTLENKLNVVKQYLPHILNYATVDFVNGKPQIKSKWLNHILNGNKITMTIVDGLNTENGETAATADINEADLHALTLNLALHGVNISIKHSDRSTFFGYKLNNGTIFDYQEANTSSEEDVINYLTKVLQDALQTEVKRSNLTNAPIFQYFIKNYKQSQLFKELGNIQNLNPYSDKVAAMITESVKTELQKYKDDLTKHGIFDNNIGIDKALVEYHNNDINLMIASSFANQMLTHLEEVKIFLSDFSFFKNADDFYKRMSTTSGTGENLVVDQVTNDYIEQVNSTKFEIVNPRTGETEEMVYNKDSNGIMTGMTIAEKDDYVSQLYSVKDKISPLTGEEISSLQYTFEWNLLQDEMSFLQEGEELSAETQDRIKRLSKAYSEAYNGINENDGQSWMNMFFFREYMIRLGNWSTAMDNLFNIELQILNARTTEDLKNINVEIDGETINVFDNALWKDGAFESVHTLKSQYAGPVQTYIDYRNKVQNDMQQFGANDVNGYAIYKTSYHALWPSTVLGTNLQQMHYFMIKNKVDVMHMNSANKSGAVDIQEVFKRTEGLNKAQARVATEGFNFYGEDGHFNDSVFDGELGSQLLEQSLAVANLNHLKDQVRIGNKEKEEIKGSTQSLKIMISNLMPNGKPRFEGADVLAKAYTDVIATLVERNITKLKDEVGFDGNAITKIDTLVNLIRSAAKDRQSPVNIIQAIDAFLYDPYIESLPNKSKLENIFYSIINNNVVSFNRPGNSYPQVASTGFEQLGSRQTTDVDGKLEVMTSNDLVNFYSIETNESGAITKVNPAEVIMPLPTAWIQSVLKAAKTKNLSDAVEWLNTQIASGAIDTEITFKGLRIPNQQLSSNDIVKVKKFHVPSNKNYIVVPSEIVVKVGADFDIDKLNIYWTNSNSLFKNKDVELGKDLSEYSTEELYNVLLQYEKKILLHPRNAHMLLMPVIDDLLKKEAFTNIVNNLKGESKDNTTYLQALTPTKNVEKSIDFVKSKFGVGIVALDITGHAVFMNDNINLNTFYYNTDGDQVSTKLNFAGLEDVYTLTAMTDQSGRIISDIQSQIMNSQVDAGKDPYAVKLGINNQTLNMVLYLNRRTVDIQTALKFVNQPLIQQYLIEQRKNESFINKERGEELSKAELIEKVLTQNKLNGTRFNPNFSITNQQLEAGLKNKQMNNDQAQMFYVFLKLVDEVSAFNDVKNSLTVDTKGKKDKAGVESFRSLQDKVSNTGLLSKESIDKLRTEGLLAPFHNAQDLYEQFYNPFYAIDNSEFGPYIKAFKQIMEDRQRGAYKKEKVRNTIENDFFLFLIQNYNQDFSIDDFNQLFGLTEGIKSLPEEIKDLQNSTDNPVIRAMFPLISISKETITDRMHDVLRLFERELSSIDLNDFIDAMADIKDENEDLYKKIIRMSIYQAGFMNSPFSMNKIFPTLKETTYDGNKLTDFKNEYLRDIQIEILRQIPSFAGDTARMINQFEQLFFMNNPEFLAKRWYSKSAIKFYYPYSRAAKKSILMYKESKDSPGIVIPQLGSSYYKRYFISLLDGGVQPVVEEIDSTNNDEFTIISGGQFGSDYGGLLAGKELGFKTGGTAPKGYKVDYTDKRAVQGSNKELSGFGLTEDVSSDYPSRTMKNVNNSDGTIAFLWGDSVGTSKTLGFAQRGTWTHYNPNFNGQPKKPYLVITTKNVDEAANQIKEFVEKNNIKVLNIAGHRETSQKGIEEFTRQSLVQGLKNLDYSPKQGQQLLMFDGAEPTTITVNPSNVDKDFNADITAEPVITNNGEEIKFIIRDKGKWIGRVYTKFDKEYGVISVYSTDIKGEPNSGTSAYLQIAEYAYQNGYEFQSDTDDRMNEASVRLWERFVKVGLAEKQSGENNGYAFILQPEVVTKPGETLSPLLSEFKDEILAEFGFDRANEIVADEFYYDYLMKKLKAFNPSLRFQYYETSAGYVYSIFNRDINTIGIDEATSYYLSRGVADIPFNKVFLNTTARKKTIVHEAVHQTLEQELSKRGEFYIKMAELLDYAVTQTKEEAYGFDNTSEFLAEALSNPEFMKLLNEIPYKRESVFTEMLNIISSFLAKIFGIEINTGSVLAEVISLSERVIQDKNNLVETELNKINEDHNMLTQVDVFFPDKQHYNDEVRSVLNSVLDKLPPDITLSCSL